MATMLDASEQADSNLARSDGPNDHLKASCRGAEGDLLPKRALLFDTWLLVNSVSERRIGFGLLALFCCEIGRWGGRANPEPDFERILGCVGHCSLGKLGCLDVRDCWSGANPLLRKEMKPPLLLWPLQWLHLESSAWKVAEPFAI